LPRARPFAKGGSIIIEPRDFHLAVGPRIAARRVRWISSSACRVPGSTLSAVPVAHARAHRSRLAAPSNRFLARRRKSCFAYAEGRL